MFVVTQQRMIAGDAQHGIDTERTGPISSACNAIRLRSLQAKFMIASMPAWRKAAHAASDDMNGCASGLSAMLTASTFGPSARYRATVSLRSVLACALQFGQDDKVVAGEFGSRGPET